MTVLNLEKIKSKFIDKIKKYFKLKKLIPTVVVVDPGGIGDYMLCRPYFKYLKQSPKYKGCEFIYLCKSSYQNMTSHFDFQYFDKIIGYDGHEYQNNKYYSRCLLNTIHRNREIKSLIALRLLTVCKTEDWKIRENIIKHIKTKNKIIGVIDLDNKLSKDKNLKIYNEIYSINSHKNFETDNRKYLFEKILNCNITNCDEKILEDNYGDFIAISIMAVAKSRLYSDDKWVEILNYILMNHKNLNLLFLGSNSEKQKINTIISKLIEKERCINVAGEISISSVPYILKNAKMLLSVESGNVHIAQAVNCKFICLSNGAYYNRYQPYNTPNAKYVYPKSFIEFLEKASDSDLIYMYNFNTKFKTSDIEVDEVINEINNVLKR